MKRYFFYAASEILLVVIGILIAVSINNWNEVRKNRATENKLLLELKENLSINIKRLNDDIILEDKTIEAINYIAEHFDARRDYQESLDSYFKLAFFAPDIVLSESAFESIRSRGFEIIKSDELRKSIIELFDVSYANMISETVRLENQFWPAAILPIKHKYFRPVDEQRIRPVNYMRLLNDPIYLNTILDRKNFRAQAKNLKNQCLLATQATMNAINKYLEKDKN